MNLCLPEITLMENALLENDSNTWPKGDVSLKLDLEMTQCNAEERKKKRRKEKRKTQKKNQTSNSLKSKDIDDNLPNGTSIKASPVKVDSILHPSVSTCLSTDLEITQHDAEVILSQNVDNGKKKNSRHNVLTSNDTDQNFQNVGCQPSCYLTNTEFVERVDGNSVSEVAEQLPSFQKCLDASSTKKHDDQTQVDTSLDLRSAKPNQRKKQNWREKGKLSDSSVTSLVSIKEVAPPSLLVVQDASSTKKHDDQAQVDTSLDLSSAKPNQRKKQNRREKRKLSDSSVTSLVSIKEVAPPSSLVVQDASSTKKHDDQAQVDTSLDLSSAKPNQRKKQNRREKRKLSDSSVTSLVSIKEVAPPSLLVVQDNSVRDTSLNHSHEAYASGCSDEIMGVGEVVAERGTLKGINTDQSVVNDASRVDLPDDDQAQRKKRVRRNRRKRRKLFDSSVTSLGSINNVASPSLLVVQEASASASGCSDKMMGVREVVAEHGTSLLVTTGGISLDKASGECPVCEPASGEQERKVEMANLKGINADQSVVNDASRVDLPDDDQAQRKKRAKRNWRTKTKLFDSSVTCLGSIKEVASSSLLVVQEAYASACGCSDKMKGVGKVVAERGTSLLVTTGGISLDKASDECPDSKPASGEHKKVELENLKRINNEQCVVNDASRVDLRNFFCEHGNGDKDKPHVIHSAVLDDDQATKPNQRKKRVKSNKRIRGKFSDSGVTSLGSIKEAASPSVLVVQDSSVRDFSLNHSDEAYASGCSEKMMGVGEMVAEHGTSLLVRGHISLGKASGEFPDGEPASGEQERKVELENNASWVDPQENFCEHANGDKEKPNVIQNAVLDDDRVQIDASFDVGSTKPCQGKKRVKSNKRKRGKFSDSGVTSLGSIVEAASPSVLVVQDSSVRDTSLNHSDKAYASRCSEKMMGVGEVVAEHGTSLLVRGHISLGKASGEFPDDEPASREQEKKVEMENLKVINNEQSVVNDASQVDLSEISFEHDKRDKDKPNVIQNAMLDVSAEENFHKSTTFYEDDEASDDASGSDPSVENLEYDNLGIQPKLKDAIPSSSQFGTMTDDDHDVSLAVIGKEGPRQRLQSSLRVPPDNLKKKLLVLDVNGLLADIFPYVSGRHKPDKVISQKAVFKRPFCDDFLQFCFERFRVGVWSSRTKKNVESVIGFLMGNFKHNLLFCWNQSHCTRTGFYTVENKEKPLVLKEIKKLWEKRDRNLPWKRGEYNESNTLLLDDSPYKALCNPPHTAIFPHSYQYKNVKDNSLGPGGDLRVYLEGLAMADNVRKYVELNPFGQRPITKTNLSWEYYLKVISSISSPKEEDAQ